MDIKNAKYLARTSYGVEPSRLLTIGNPKTVKGEKRGYLTAVLHLAPADLSGRNVCPMASPGCKAACLNTAGRGGIFKAGESTNRIQEARKRKTRMYFEDRPMFMAILEDAIRRHVSKAEKQGLIPTVRLNGTSDLDWTKSGIMERFPDVQFYDYTKVVNRMAAWVLGQLPDNYHLTFSRSEDTPDGAVAAWLEEGANVAVVVSKDADRTSVMERFEARHSVDGDESDLRFLDDPGHGHGAVVFLKAKGRARGEATRFVLNS